VRIAIIGSGVSGLVCSYLLSRDHEVTLYEADDRAGGHANTLSVTLDGVEHAVDTGFIVYNERNYPVVSNLFAQLGVATRPSDMSFAMSDDAADLEWCGTSLVSVFAQRRNLARPAFWRMLRDVVRFNRSARAFLAEPENLGYTLEDFLEGGHYSAAFIDWCPWVRPSGRRIPKSSCGSRPPLSSGSSTTTVCSASATGLSGERWWEDPCNTSPRSRSHSARGFD